MESVSYVCDEDDVAQRRAHNERQIVSQVIRSGVFHDILSYLAYTYPPGRSKKGSFPLGWIYATHVCTSLRYSALETSSLWARHVCAFGAEQVFRVLLDRAGSFPITIDNVRDYILSNYDHRVYSIPEHYLPVLSRAASISLIGGSKQMAQVARELSGRATPYLTTLKVHCSQSDSTHTVQAVPVGAAPDQPGQPPLYAIVPPTLHAQLRDVELVNTYMPILGHNIVSLRIAGKLRDSEPAAHHLLLMLRNCANLESLRLHGFMRNAHHDIDPSVSDEPSMSVHLPRLVELVLQGRSSLYMASRLVHPPLEVASVLQGGGERTTIDDVKSALSSMLGEGSRTQAHTENEHKVYILKFYESSMTPELGCLLTVRASKSCIGDQRIFGYRTILKETLGLRYPYTGPGMSEPQLTISVSGLDPVYNTQPEGTMFLEETFATHRALRPGLLEHIEVVHISVHPTRPLDWRKLLAPFTFAQTLVMAYEQPSLEDDDGLVDALSEVFGDSILLLPRLETIVTDKRVPWRPRDHLRFREMLIARANRGSPVRLVRGMVEKEAPNALMKKYYDDLVDLPNMP